MRVLARRRSCSEGWGAGLSTSRPLPLNFNIKCKNDVVLSVSSVNDLQRAAEKFATECEAAGMSVGTSQS